MKFLLGLLLLFLYHTVSYSHSATSVPPTLVTDLSKKVISINVNFSGSKFHIFGAAKRGFSQTASIDQPPFDILIEVIGPSVSLDLFKKERLYGFWVNKKINTFEAIPSFYSISGTKSPDEIVSEETKKLSKIGLFEQIKIDKQIFLDYTVLELIALTKKARTAYRQESKPITFLENTLFSTEIDLPTDLIEGNYLVRIHLVRFNEVLATKEDLIFVKKVGLEQWVNYLAFEKPEIYGLLAIFLAIALGWAASIIFNRKAY